jgi:hypothetical protein
MFMQLSGRLVIIAIFSIALAMAGGAWLYQYNYSRRSAEFWGPAAKLIARSPELQYLQLAPLPTDETEQPVDPADAVAGRAVADHHDLRNKRGLVHFRHAFTQDDNFLWDARSREAAASRRDWSAALRFVDGAEEQFVLLGNDFQLLGKLSHDGTQVDVLPCPRMAKAIKQYLTDVGALRPAPREATPAAAAEDSEVR